MQGHLEGPLSWKARVLWGISFQIIPQLSGAFFDSFARALLIGQENERLPFGEKKNIKIYPIFQLIKRDGDFKG